MSKNKNSLVQSCYDMSKKHGPAKGSQVKNLSRILKRCKNVFNVKEERFTVTFRVNDVHGEAEPLEYGDGSIFMVVLENQRHNILELSGKDYITLNKRLVNMSGGY